MRPEKGLFIFWICVDILVLVLIADLIHNHQTPPSSKAFIVILFIGLFSLNTWLQLRFRIVLKNGILTFTDAIRSQDIKTILKIDGYVANLPIKDIRYVIFGYPKYVNKALSAPDTTKSTVITAAVGGLWSPAATGGAMARLFEPILAFVTKNGEVYAATAKPYSKADCKKLVEILRANKIEVRVQDSFIKMLKLNK